MEEQDIIDSIAIEEALSKLDPADREMMLLVSHIHRPADWIGGWPPKYAEIAEYIGIKYYNKPRNEATIRYRIKQLQEMWQGNRGPLRSQKGSL